MRDPVLELCNKVTSLHDTDADVNLVDSLVETADKLSTIIEAGDEPGPVLEDFIQLAEFLREYMEDDMTVLLDNANVMMTMV